MESLVINMVVEKDPNEVFNEHADNYSEEIDKSLESYGVNHDFFTAHKSWLIGDLAEKNNRKLEEMVLLDVGCGVGKIHPLLQDKFKHIVGVDVSNESIKVAKKMQPDLEYHWYDGLTLPQKNNQFDLAIAICVFHHIPPENWLNMAKEMMRVVKKDGFVLIIEHNPYNPVTRHVVNNCPLDDDAVLLTRKKLGNLFKQAGATQVTSRCIVTVPPINNFMKRIDEILGALPFGAQHYMLAQK